MVVFRGCDGADLMVHWSLYAGVLVVDHFPADSSQWEWRSAANTRSTLKDGVLTGTVT
jgi:hypothetical protein